MPDAKLIQQPPDELVDLFVALGVVTPPGQWWLSDTVLPISIVDSRVSLTAESTPLEPDARVTAGEQTNPAANTRQADTTALAAGTYWFRVKAACHASNLNFRVKQRDAADAADVNSELFGVVQSTSIEFERVFTLAANERVVIENHSAPGAGVLVQGVLWYALL